MDDFRNDYENREDNQGRDERDSRNAAGGSERQQGPQGPQGPYNQGGMPNGNGPFYSAQGQGYRVYGAPMGAGYGAPYPPPKKGMPGWLKFLITLAVVLIIIIFAVTSCTAALSGVTRSLSGGSASTNVIIGSNSAYIGVIYVNGSIVSGVASEYNLNAIDAMMEDKNNKGIVMVVDSPGGSVFTSDEIYFKILEYQKETKRPVYSSMQSMAASGGYYISASCDKIIANRNCWTGSIGVTLGTMYDISGLLSKLGISANTITSGANKAMGGSDAPMTEEQRAIFQSLVDEAYEQFVGIVAEGREMDIAKVKELADGRIYTAKQAVDNGLIDQIGTFEEAVEDMKKSYNLQNCELEHLSPPQSKSLLDLLTGMSKTESGAAMSVKNIKALLELNGKVEVMYMSNFQG